MDKTLSVIYNELKKLGLNVYDKRPNSKVNYPFLVYQVNEPLVNVNPVLYTLSINIWTLNESYEHSELIASNINKMLYDKVLSDDDGLFIKLKKNNEYRIEDPNLDIKRKEISYQLRVFSKNQGGI